MRLERVDILRWVAIFLMVLFHLNYSLVHIFWIEFLNFSHLFWFILWRFSALTFIFVAWFSFFLASEKYKGKIYKKYFYYCLQLTWIALWITLFTNFFIPSQFIVFWIIHFFALAFMCMLVFYRFWYINIVFWILFIWLWLSDFTSQNHFTFFLWFPYAWFTSADYYPLVPYFWYMLLGYSFWKYIFDSGKWELFQIKKQSFISRGFVLVWKKSLFIYLIHQPIIVGVVYILTKTF